MAGEHADVVEEQVFLHGAHLNATNDLFSLHGDIIRGIRELQRNRKMECDEAINAPGAVNHQAKQATLKSMSYDADDLRGFAQPCSPHLESTTQESPPRRSAGDRAFRPSPRRDSTSPTAHPRQRPAP